MAANPFHCPYVRAGPEIDVRCARHAGRGPENPNSPETDTLPSSKISLQMDRLKLGGLALPRASANKSRHLAHEHIDPVPTAVTRSLD